MDELEQKSLYCTKSHKDEDLDFIFNQDTNNLEDVIFHDNQDFFHDLKVYWRLFRKNYLTSFNKEKKQKNFVNIIYLTLDCPLYTPNSAREDSPLDYIVEMQKQYPQNDIRVLLPIINLDEDFKIEKKITLDIDGKLRMLEKTSISFEFFLQNRIQTAVLYKFSKNESNIQVYGIYSPVFSHLKNISELSRIQYLAPFLKAARSAIKNLSKENFPIDMVHCENIPYYLGCDFEKKFTPRTKVFQIIKDFIQVDVAKPEAFWAAINLADKKTMQKICRDSLIKKQVANLFKLHNTKRFYKMKDCLYFIYKNYYKFRKYIDKGEEVEENYIFNRLNARILQMFPNVAYGEDLYFNPMFYTLKKANCWGTVSESYYNEIYNNPKLSGKMFKQIEKTKEKSFPISICCNLKKYPKENTRKIYECFNEENFRDLRGKNKEAILKEFSKDRIQTNFIDPTLFKKENAKIYGYLDSFYNAPLLFANPTSEIFANGVDILFNSLLKLFELHKNIQIIISIKDGTKINFIKNWIDFISSNKYFDGRWVFIDGEINLPKFLASSDMILIPRRANISTIEHFIAMNYGCVPVVSRNGILNDTISDIFDDISNGCGFKTKTGLIVEEDGNELFSTPLMKAINLYQNNPNSWNLLIKNCLNYDSNWSFSVLEKYNKIYKELL